MADDLARLPQAETMLVYASILEKPQYFVKNGVKFLLPTGEIVEAACSALRLCAAMKADTGAAPKNAHNFC